MEQDNETLIQFGGSKRISVADDVRIKAKRVNDDWGTFDQEQGFHLYDVPNDFRTEAKVQNYKLSLKEEKQQKLILESKPYHIDIEPTNICNLKCPLCSTGIDAKTRKKGTLTFEKFKHLIDESKDTILQLSLQNWGEPTLVTDLPKMIRYAVDSGVFVRLSTNLSIKYPVGYLEQFIKSGLGRLIVDIDGTTQDVYEKYRQNGNLNTVLKNLEDAIKIKKQNKLQYPIIQARMLVMKHNEHQIDEFKELVRKLCVDEIELGNIQLNPNTASKDWLPKNDEFVYETYMGERRKTPCHWPWSGMVISWDGGVAPCSIIDDENSDFGNVFENDIMSIWNNEYYVSARSEFTKTKEMSKFTICNMCKNDTHNPNLFRVGDSFSLTLNRSAQNR